MIYVIYLLTEIRLTPGGSSTVHIYTQTIHRTTQITTNLEECGPCPVFAGFNLAFALQLRKKHEKVSVRVRKSSVRVKYTHYQTPTHYKTYTHTHTHIHTHTHTHKHTHTLTLTHYKIHTLQNNIKSPQYKLKHTQCKMYPNEIITI